MFIGYFKDSLNIFLEKIKKHLLKKLISIFVRILEG
jgi:hypothetical protein